MPAYLVLAYGQEPDLSEFLGNSLADVRTYEELISKIRALRPDCEECVTPSSEELSTPRRLTLQPEVIAARSTLVFGMTGNRQGVIRYNVFLDASGTILGVENDYGYKGPNLTQFIARFAPYLAAVALVVLASIFLWPG